MTTALVPPDLDQRLRDLFAGDAAALADPFSTYAEVRTAGRVVAHQEMVLLTHHDDVKWALRATEDLSSRGLVEGSRVRAARARLDGDARDAFDEVTAFQSHFVSRNDGEHHARLRRIAHRAFTPRRIAALEAAAQRDTEALLADAPRDGVWDAMRLANDLPLLIVADLLGVPRADRELISSWSATLAASNASTEPEVFLAAREATRQFRAYVDEMLDDYRHGRRRTELVALLMDAEQDERATEEELAAMLVQFLFAGHDTTKNLLGTGLLELLRSPDQWRLLAEDPGRVPDAVEELVRFVSPSQFATRLARRDLDVAGAPIPEGQTVVAVIAAGNRDPAVFADPDRLDVTRPDARAHLGFGFGPHVCLGAALARLEAQVVFGTLARRHPRLELVDEPLRWRGGAMLRNLEALPVRLGAPRR